MSKSKVAGVLATLALGMMGTQVAVADQTLTLPFRDVMAMPEAQNRLSPAVTLYFGDQLYPTASSQQGGFYFTERSSRVLKNVQSVCRRTALASLLDLQNRANELGSNAVTNISSYYNQHTIQGENYQCNVGPFTASVTLKGNMAIINNQ
ncbi:putative heavy-metal-binding [Halomonadaceae bacterium LMG 33818]|uniref:hypothetical protein n=1 Tax=Cernens ardua TaxID=3402176 RepID=UPI003EDB7652